jgi:hypothetical protein
MYGSLTAEFASRRDIIVTPNSMIPDDLCD